MSSERSFLTEIAALVKRRLVALRDFLHARVDAPELEQAVLRVALSSVVLAVFWGYIGREEALSARESQVLTATVAFVVLSLALLARIVHHGGTSVVRRYLGIVLDNAGITFFMAMMGEAGAVMFGLYLFIIFGNGFRYGRTYLHVCQVMSLTGFGAVILLDDHWLTSRSVGFACFAAILVLPFYVSVLAQRITDARKKADEANQAKGRFVANVSHEMRTPLNGVIAMADVLRETRLTESQREIVDTMMTSAHLLLVQIEDVLDMAKIESGRVQIERRPFDLGKLLSSTVKVILPQARYKGLAVNVDIAANASTWFAGDANHVRQVVLNLLSNAVKFTERGEIVLRARSLAGADGNCTVRIEVQDTGIGVPADKQASIFEPFTQADDSITRLYGGTGLGTTIARHLVHQMGGRIGLVSDVGKGSTFWIELPLPTCEPQGIDLSAEWVANTKSSQIDTRVATNVRKIRGARILVAEDNATNQRVAQLILESGGHRVTIVENGEEALEALETGTYDLALFDLSMPVVSGLEALKLYRFSTSNPIPILILSANVTTDAIAECERAGAQEFIAKPLRASILLEAIDRHANSDSEQSAPSVTASIGSDERQGLTVVETPVLDPGILTDLTKLSADPTFVDRLLEGYRADVDRLVTEICDAFAARKYDVVKDAAHALKGGSGSVGAIQMLQIATRLDKASHETLRLRATSLIDELRQASNRTSDELARYLEGRRAAGLGNASRSS
jgi:two-component system sensor histidine kinase RpfC